jgi:hypothetical protein
LEEDLVVLQEAVVASEAVLEEEDLAVVVAAETGKFFNFRQCHLNKLVLSN